jgi:hypothetical protein
MDRPRACSYSSTRKFVAAQAERGEHTRAAQVQKAPELRLRETSGAQHESCRGVEGVAGEVEAGHAQTAERGCIDVCDGDDSRLASLFSGGGELAKTIGR